MYSIFENDKAIATLNQSLKENLKIALGEIYKIKETEKDEDLIKRLFHAEENIDSVVASLKKINQMIIINSYPQNRWKKIEISNPIQASYKKHIDKAKAKNIKFTWTNNTHRAISYGDEILLEEFIFDNLIENAIKFAPNDSEIKMTLSHNKDYNIFEIDDNGIGIEEERIEALYSVSDRFFTPDTDGELGSGMSFPIILKILKKLNGHIKIESSRTTTQTKTRGTNIKIYFNRF